MRKDNNPAEVKINISPNEFLSRSKILEENKGELLSSKCFMIFLS